MICIIGQKIGNAILHSRGLSQIEADAHTSRNMWVVMVVRMQYIIPLAKVEEEDIVVMAVEEDVGVAAIDLTVVE